MQSINLSKQEVELLQFIIKENLAGLLDNRTTKMFIDIQQKLYDMY